MEDNICVYRDGEISHTSAVLVSCSCYTRIMRQLERTFCFPVKYNDQGMPDNKGRRAKELKVVGGTPRDRQCEHEMNSIRAIV